MNNKHWWLYVLKCEDEKWYVGITTKTPEQRFAEHRYGIGGAAWTRLHKPIEIYESRALGPITKDEAESEENLKVREYIQEYGLDNVRGGDLSQTQKYSAFAHRIFSHDQWEWFRMTLYFAVLSAFLLGLYIYEHFTK